MSSTIRPVRRAAQIAAIRINEFMTTADNSDSDSSNNSNNTDGLKRARQHGYDSTIYITRYLLEQCEQAASADEKISIAQKLFENLNKNPTILVYEPVVRNAVVNKIKEVDEFLKEGNNKYNRVKYNDALKMLKLSMRTNIQDSYKRQMIYKNLDDINSILTDYEDWMNNMPLKKHLTALTSTLDTIKKHPSYVEDTITAKNN